MTDRTTGYRTLRAPRLSDHSACGWPTELRMRTNHLDLVPEPPHARH